MMKVVVIFTPYKTLFGRWQGDEMSGHAARMGEKRSTYRILMGKTE